VEPASYARPTNVAPYANATEAAQNLNEAYRLYAQGEKRDGAARIQSW